MQHRQDIDGLRALAVLPVLFFHANFPFFQGGFVGVDIFFVISGFLITSIIIEDCKQSRFSILKFYERRARRILPALFLVMLTCLPFAWLWMLPGELKDFSKSLIAVSSFSSNFLFYFESDYFAPNVELKPLLHTWSLAIEEQYYVFFPLLISSFWWAGKKTLIFFIALLGLFSLCLAQFGGNIDWGNYSLSHPLSFISIPDWGFYFPFSRIWEILAGALTAFYLDNKKQHPKQNTSQILSLLGLGLILLSIFLFNSQTPFPSLYGLIPVLGTILIIIFSLPKTLVARLLSCKALVGAGLISYSLYLWHQPLFAFTRLYLLDEPAPYIFAGLIVLSCGLAYLSWRFVERPFRERAVTNQKQIFALTILGTTFFLACGLSGYVYKGFPKRMSPEVLEILKAKNNTNPKAKQCDASSNHYIKPQLACITGNAPPKIAVLGDSHAAALAYELGKTFSNQGVLQLTYNGCPPIRNLKRLDHSNLHKCASYNKEVFSYLKNSPSIQTIILSARWTLGLESVRFNNEEGGRESRKSSLLDVISYPNDMNSFSRKERIAQTYIKGLSDLVALGKRVILIYPIPEVGWDVPTYLAKNLRKGETFSGMLSTSYAVFVNRNQYTHEVLDKVGSHSNLTRLKPEEIFCDTYLENRCIAQLKGKPLYRDDDHLTNTGAALIVKELQKHL